MWLARQDDPKGGNYHNIVGMMMQAENSGINGALLAPLGQTFAEASLPTFRWNLGSNQRGKHWALEIHKGRVARVTMPIKQKVYERNS